MEVGVEAEDAPGKSPRTYSAYLTIVALDKDENPVQVDPLEPSRRGSCGASARRTCAAKLASRSHLTSHIMISPPATGRNTPVR